MDDPGKQFPLEMAREVTRGTMIDLRRQKENTDERVRNLESISNWGCAGPTIGCFFWHYAYFCFVCL